MSRLTLMYITNSPQQAVRAVEAGVDRIFVDLEKIGKEERQGGLDTVKSDHSIEDVAAIRQALPNAELLVRINPLGTHSEAEVEAVVGSGADFVMLPMFTTSEHVETLLNLVNGRARINLLLETPQALVRLPEYLRFAEHIDEIHVGLNDLHLAMNLDFMFELLAGGIMDPVAARIQEHGIRFGFGGVARAGHGDIPAEDILMEHVRLGSEMVILSRSFHQDLAMDGGQDPSFEDEIRKLREWEDRWRTLSRDELDEKSRELRRRIFAFARTRRMARGRDA